MAFAVKVRPERRRAPPFSGDAERRDLTRDMSSRNPWLWVRPKNRFSMRGFRKLSGTELCAAFRRTEMVNVPGHDFLQRRVRSHVGAADGILLQQCGAG